MPNIHSKTTRPNAYGQQAQQVPIQRLVDYGRRWLGWFTVGVALATRYVESIKLGFITEAGA